jgi:hypothetical protein
MQAVTQDQVTVRLGEPQQLNFMLRDATTELQAVVIKASSGRPRANSYGAGKTSTATS